MSSNNDDFRTKQAELIGELKRYIATWECVGTHNREVGKLANKHLEDLEKAAESVLLLCEYMANWSTIKRLK